MLIRYLKKVIDSFESYDLMLLASSMAFMSLLAIVPALAVSLSVFNVLGGFDSVMEFVRPLLISYLTPGVGTDIVASIEAAISRINSGTLGVTSLFFVVYVSFQLISKMEEAIQRIWGLKKRRPFWQRLIGFSAMTILGPILASLLVGLLSVRYVAEFNPLPAKTMVFALSSIVLFFAYFFVPNKPVKPWKAFAVAISVALIFLVMQMIYVWVSQNLFSYNKIYGSLASIPIFLVWLEMLWVIFFSGALACAQWSGR